MFCDCGLRSGIAADGADAVRLTAKQDLLQPGGGYAMIFGPDGSPL